MNVPSMHVPGVVCWNSHPSMRAIEDSEQEHGLDRRNCQRGQLAGDHSPLAIATNKRRQFVAAHAHPKHLATSTSWLQPFNVKYSSSLIYFYFLLISCSHV